MTPSSTHLLAERACASKKEAVTAVMMRTFSLPHSHDKSFRLPPNHSDVRDSSLKSVTNGEKRSYDRPLGESTATPQQERLSWREFPLPSECPPTIPGACSSSRSSSAWPCWSRPLSGCEGIQWPMASVPSSLVDLSSPPHDGPPWPEAVRLPS